MSTTSPTVGHSPRVGDTTSIGIFDSGIGGFSVVRALRRQPGDLRLLYVADNGHAPYGERSDAYVVARALRVVEHLKREGAGIVVVACNTATAAAVDALRAAHPALAVVGVEPGIKPAVAATRNGRIGVMATTLTLSSDRYRRLIDQHARDCVVMSQPCPGLASAIESLDPHSQHQIDLELERHTAPLRAADVDTVVLGCTHYALVADRIQASLGHAVRLIDTSEAVAMQVLRHAGLHEGAHAASQASSPVYALRLWSTANEVAATSLAVSRWLSGNVEMACLPGL